MTDKERAAALQEELKKLQNDYFNTRFQLVYNKQDETNRRIEEGFKEFRENIAELFDRLGKVEVTEKACPIGYLQGSFDKHKIENVQKFDKIDEVIEALDYYQKHPGQFKLVFFGTIILFMINIGIVLYQFKDLFGK